MTHNVFVFGTLKRGQPNFYLLEDAGNGLAVYLGDGVTEEKFPVVISSSCNIPFMLPVAGKGKVIFISTKFVCILLLRSTRKIKRRQKKTCLLTFE